MPYKYTEAQKGTGLQEEKMFGECHAHVIMDGVNYKRAVGIHEDGVKDDVIRSCFAEYQKRGISFVRDGGDALGVSKRARELAVEYGIDYRTPVFAIHKEGHYGSIVGKSFRDMKEYHQLVLEAKKEGADFIKIMTTGLMDFVNHGEITGTPLDEEEVKEMVNIAHGEGFSVMSHTNGDYGVRAAVAAGTDSIEHGNYMNEETVCMLAESETVWVPTLVTVRNLRGCGRYQDKTLLPIIKCAEENLRLAYRMGAHVALGSDGGAYMVPHGQGLLDEEKSFCDILEDSPRMRQWLLKGEEQIRRRFCRQ